MKKYGLIGFPLEHSLSPEIYWEIFDELGLTGCSYELLPIQSDEELKLFFKEAKEFSGLNVTIPYKRKALLLMDRLSAEAEMTGAVNCIRVRGGEETSFDGYNTDFLAFREIIEPVVRMRNFSALVLGTGGASLAVGLALSQLEIPFLKVSRDPRKGDITYDDLDEALMRAHRLIINTTPLGMYPDVETFPDIPYECLEPGYVCFDLVYNPPKTKFLEKAEQRGAGIINGELMLYRQAVKSVEIWLGRRGEPGFREG